MEIHTGYVRKVNIGTGQLLESYSYAELLLYRSLRAQLRAEILSNANIQLFCACSCKNDRPVYLNDACSIYFPRNCGHHSSCTAYLSLFSKYLSLPSVSMIVGEDILNVNFRWRKGSHTKIGVIQDIHINAIIEEASSLSLEDVIKFINLRVLHKICSDILHNKRIRYPNSDEMLFEIAYEFGKYTLCDPEGCCIALKEQHLFSNNALPGISFVYAKAVSIERSYKNNVYITAQHINGKSSFSLQHKKWDYLEPYLETELPLYICGFVRSTEVKPYIKRGHDSITHAFQTGRSNHKMVHELTSFCLFHATLNGILCTTLEDFNKYNSLCSLCSEGANFCIPYFPEI